MKRNDQRIDAVWNSAVLNSALDSYPLVPAPHGFRRSVMAKVRREATVEARLYPAQVKFRLGPLDFLLPALIALLLSAPLALLLWGIYSLDPLALPRLRLELLTFIQNLFSSPWLLPGLFGAVLLGMLLSAALAAVLILPGRVEWQVVDGD